MKKMMMNAALMSLAAIEAMKANPADSVIPRPSFDSSKPATLTRKQWKKRKRKNSIAKHSRKINRI